MLDLFDEKTNLLKRAYFAYLLSDPHADHDSSILSLIVEHEPGFLLEYVEWRIAHTNETLYDNRGYGFIWSRPDALELMEDTAERIMSLERERLGMDTLLGAFFRIRGNRDDSGQLVNKQDAFLCAMIQAHANDIEWMKFLFRAISGLPPERRKAALRCFLHENKNVEVFKRLPLESSHWTYSGSAVPTLQGRIEYWESLLPLVESVDYLVHKGVVERQIAALREEIELEKRRDFLGHR